MGLLVLIDVHFISILHTFISRLTHIEIFKKCGNTAIYTLENLIIFIVLHTEFKVFNPSFILKLQLFKVLQNIWQLHNLFVMRLYIYHEYSYCKNSYNFYL